jgi:multiple sugar transport system substrate-binding protein
MNTKNKRFSIMLFSLLAVVAMLLSACGSAATTATEPPVQQPVESITAPEATAAPTDVPAPAEISGKLVIMFSTEELSDESLKEFTDKYPKLTVERVPTDETRLRAMIAAGEPPDVFQLGGSQMPAYLSQGVLLNLDDYFAKSEVLKADDLAPANSFFMWDGAKLGSGSVYGMAKDWSPDYSLWINPDTFAEAGIALPDTTKPITYQQMFDWAKQLTKKNGDKVERIGMTFETYNLEAVVQFRCAEDGVNIYSDDFKTVTIKDNPCAVEAIKYYYDASVEGITWSPLNPSPNGWNGKDFQLGLVGITSNGYWYSGLLRGDSTAPMYDKAIMLPAPTWGKMRYSPAFGPSGTVLAAASKNPDAAWAFFEWFNAGTPAMDRAKSGWGVPSLKSYMQYMPQETAFDKQTYAVVQDEMANAAYIRPINPYFASGPAFETTFKTNLELALRGEITFDQMIENIDAEMNQALQDGLAASGQ